MVKKKYKKKCKHVVYDVHKREIWLSGEIVKKTYRLLKTAIDKISRHYAGAPIRFFISTIGGRSDFAQKIYWLINQSRVPIETVAVNEVISAGFFILQAGKRRLAFPKVTIRFHQAENNPADLKKLDKFNADVLGTNVEYLKEVDAVQKFIFISRSRSVQKILELFSREAVVSARTAKKLHLIDEIIKAKRRPK